MNNKFNTYYTLTKSVKTHVQRKHQQISLKKITRRKVSFPDIIFLSCWVRTGCPTFNKRISNLVSYIGATGGLPMLCIGARRGKATMSWWRKRWTWFPLRYCHANSRCRARTSTAYRLPAVDAPRTPDLQSSTPCRPRRPYWSRWTWWRTAVARYPVCHRRRLPSTRSRRYLARRSTVLFSSVDHRPSTRATWVGLAATSSTSQ